MRPSGRGIAPRLGLNYINVAAQIFGFAHLLR
jgi:hypothetical protein